jgi:hypothetical protein
METQLKRIIKVLGKGLKVFGKNISERKVFFQHICSILINNQKVEEFLIHFNNYLEKFQKVLSIILLMISEKNECEIVLFLFTFMYVGNIFDFLELSDVQQQWDEYVLYCNIELFSLLRIILQEKFPMIKNAFSLLKMQRYCIDAIESDTEIVPIGPEIFMRQSSQTAPHEQLLCSKCGAVCEDGLNPDSTDPFSFQGFCDGCFSNGKFE